MTVQDLLPAAIARTRMILAQPEFDNIRLDSDPIRFAADRLTKEKLEAILARKLRMAERFAEAEAAQGRDEEL